MEAEVPDDLVARTSEFVREIVLPREDEVDGDVTAAGGEELRRQLQTEVRKRGLLSPTRR